MDMTLLLRTCEPGYALSPILEATIALLVEGPELKPRSRLRAPQDTPQPQNEKLQPVTIACLL